MGDADALVAGAMITAVLEGRSDHGQIEYLCHLPGGPRWFEMAVEPLRRAEGGALVSHVDVTRRRHAEDLAQRQREELARTLRATALGQVATSLAHEVNQPLCAILSNAEAAEMLLSRENPPLEVIREIIKDIRDDDLRADEVILGIRSLVGRREIQIQPLDLNRYYVILPDGIGHGKSSKPSDGMKTNFPKYNYEDMVDAHYRLVKEGLGLYTLLKDMESVFARAGRDQRPPAR